MHKLFFIAFICITHVAFASEFNIEVTMSPDSSKSPKEIDQQLEYLGMEKIFYTKLKEMKVDEESFKKRFEEKKFNQEEKNNFFASFITHRELIKFAPLDPQLKTAIFTGNLKGELDDVKFKELVFEFTINADELKSKTFYLDLDLDLIGNTKWDDFGLSSATSFINVLQSSIKESIEKKISGFSKVIILNPQIKESLNENAKYVNEDSVILNYQVNIKRSLEDLLNKKTWFEVSSQYNLIRPSNKTSLGVIELPLQKKLLQTKEKQELNSTVVSIVFNLIDAEFDKVQKMLLAKKVENPIIVKLEGQKFFSDIYLVLSVIENTFKNQKVEVNIGQLGIEKAELKIKIPGLDESHTYLLLKTLDNRPLTNDPNEQKILVFDPLNNSLQITQKAR